MRRITAKALARADQLARKVDALGDNLLAETARGTSVHPFVGHEREARNEYRLHWQALVKDALERRGKKPKAAAAGADPHRARPAGASPRGRLVTRHRPRPRTEAAAASDGPRFAAFCESVVRHTQGRQFAGKPLMLEPFQREFFDELLAVDPRRRPVLHRGRLGAAAQERQVDERRGVRAVHGVGGRRGRRGGLRGRGREGPGADHLQPGEALRRRRRQPRARRGVRAAPQLDRPPGLGLGDQGPLVGRAQAARPQPVGERDRRAPRPRGRRPVRGADDGVRRSRAAAHADDHDGRLEQGHRARRDRRQGARAEGPDRAPPGLTIVRDRENGFLFWWHGAPDDADPDDPETGRLANPASWISDAYLRRQRNKPSMRLSDFRQLHLNQWVSAEEDWLPPGSWAECGPQEGQPALELEAELPVSVGIDVALTHDLASVVAAQRQGDRTVLRPRFWANPWPEGHPRHASWELDIGEVREYLRELFGEFPAAAAFKPDSRVRPRVRPSVSTPGSSRSRPRCSASRG
jgi:hypothetical protein